MLRHAVAVVGAVLVVGCAGEGGKPTDAATPSDAALTDLASVPGVVQDAGRDAVDAALMGLAPDRPQVDFGVFYLGCPPAGAQVVVTNHGPRSTGELLVTIDQPFKLGRDDCSARALAPGEKCTIEVGVSPEEAGELSGSLRVWSTAMDLIQVGLRVVAADVVPAFLVSPSSLDFSVVVVGQIATQKVTVSVPTGFRPVPRLVASVIGADFAIAHDGCAGVVLQPDQMCDLEIAFLPTTAGDRTAALSLSAPAPCPPFQSQVSLKGKAQ